MDRKAWRAAIHGVAKSRTRLSDWTELNWSKRKSLWYFLLALNFTFSKMYYNWHHAAYNLFQTSLFYLITFIQVASISFCDLMVHFFLFLNNILLCLCWCIIVCLSSHLLKDTLVASNLCVCVCVCVREREREREREYELSCYKIHVYVFMWA